MASLGRITLRSPTQMMISTDNLGKTGMSGSPLFNSQGEILGIYCRGGIPKGKDQPEAAVAYFTIYNHSDLQNLWSNLVF